MIISYHSSVMVDAGWRSVSITAKADKISEKMAVITEVIDIGGNGSCGYASRTGAKRQRYHVGGIANREIGKRKRLSSCKIEEV
jgi:hypothetical protein